MLWNFMHVGMATVDVALTADHYSCYNKFNHKKSEAIKIYEEPVLEPEEEKEIIIMGDDGTATVNETFSTRSPYYTFTKDNSTQHCIITAGTEGRDVLEYNRNSLLFELKTNCNATPYLGVYNKHTGKVTGTSIYYNNADNIHVWCLLNLSYQSSSHSYIYDLHLFNMNTKKWYNHQYTINDTIYTETLTMPEDYKCSLTDQYGLLGYFTIFLKPKNSESKDFTGKSIKIRNIYLWTSKLSTENVEEIINGKIILNKNKIDNIMKNNSMHALLYNECTDLYSNTTFVNDGTVLPKGELVEEGEVNQVCKNGDIKSSEFIEEF